jgi:hypothetical protein
VWFFGRWTFKARKPFALGLFQVGLVAGDALHDPSRRGIPDEGGQLVAVAAPTATARPNQPCSCQSSRCFSLACRNRTSRNYYRLRKRKQVADGQELAPSVEFEGCPWPAGPSGLCVRCRCPCGKPRHGCSRLCRDCTEQLTDREDYINEHGVHCIVLAWPRSLQLCARWAWAIIMIPPWTPRFGRHGRGRHGPWGLPLRLQASFGCSWAIV